jgi:hypothetical protein
MQQYASLWTLVRLKNTNSIPIFRRVLESPKATPHARRIANEGLWQLLEGEDLISLEQEFISRLPIVLQENIHDSLALKEHLEKLSSDYDTFQLRSKISII